MLEGLVEAEVSAGDYLGAARYAFVASMLGREGQVSGDVWNDFTYRAADLLAESVPEAQRSEEAVQAFERRVVGDAWMRDIGSARQLKVAERLAKLGGGAATFGGLGFNTEPPPHPTQSRSQHSQTRNLARV